MSEPNFREGKALVVVHQGHGYVLTWRACPIITAWLQNAGVHGIGAPFSMDLLEFLQRVGDAPQKLTASGVYILNLRLVGPSEEDSCVIAENWSPATEMEWQSFIHGVIPWA